LEICRLIKTLAYRECLRMNNHLLHNCNVLQMDSAILKYSMNTTLKDLGGNT